MRIPLNEELDAKNLARFTEYIDSPRTRNAAAGYGSVNGVTNGTHSRTSSKNVSPKDVTSPSTNSSSGIGSASTAATSVPNGPSRHRIGERGREGTVRFILNPDREREERAIVAEYTQPGREEG